MTCPHRFLANPLRLIRLMIVFFKEIVLAQEYVKLDLREYKFSIKVSGSLVIQ
jgi:energy-coupling factor transporter transmembrane protein EcfT